MGRAEDEFFCDLRSAGVVRDAEASRVVFARVRGFPAWPVSGRLRRGRGRAASARGAGGLLARGACAQAGRPTGPARGPGAAEARQHAAAGAGGARRPAPGPRGCALLPLLPLRAGRARARAAPHPCRRPAPPPRGPRPRAGPRSALDACDPAARPRLAQHAGSHRRRRRAGAAGRQRCWRGRRAHTRAAPRPRRAAPPASPLPRHAQAQILTKDFARAHLGNVAHKSRSDVPVIFFGTSEIAWVGVRDVVRWGEGMQQQLHHKGKKNKKFVVALEQVCAAAAGARRRRGGLRGQQLGAAAAAAAARPAPAPAPARPQISLPPLNLTRPAPS
jgi:hypothetical protein